MAILELRAARGWSAGQAADRFFVTATTLSSWKARIDEHGPNALLRISEPVNDVEVRMSAQARMSGGVTLDYQRAMFAAVDEAREEWRMECEHGALDLSMLPGSPQVTVRRYELI